MWAGILGTALSALVVDYLLLAPIGHFAIDSTSDIVAMAIFCISGVSISFVTELYHRRGEKLAAFQIEAAVLEERRKTEEAHARAESIRAERQRFLDVLETLPPMISLLTPDRHIAFANRSFRERFGECRGQRCFEARFGRAEPCDFCESYSVFETGQPHHWEVIFPDGSLVDAHDFPFTDLDGSSLLLEMGVDITERRRSEVELKEYRDDLESQVAERTRQLQAANAQLEADMRERKEAQRVLGNTLQRFYAILSNLSSGVLLVTNEGRIEFANQAFCSLFGLKESPTDLVATFDSEKVIAKIDTAYENHEQAVLRVREILEREQSVLGEEVSMQNGGTYRRDFVALTVEGKSYGRMWVHTDITELKRKEEALRESRAKLEAALASMTDSVLITDAEGRFVEFNDAYARFYRFKSKAEFPRDFDEFASIFEVFLTTGEQAPREMYAIQRALRGETATNAEYTLRRKDTGESWIGSISFSPIRESAGAITGAVITARDITEAKRAETRLRRFYETDLFAILYWTIDGGVLDANDKFLAMTGYSRADLRAGLVDWVHMTPPEYEALDEDARRQVRETGVHLPFEKEFIRKDGSRIWGLISAVAYEDDRTQGISFLLDITKRKRAEEALRESEKRYRNLFNAMNEGFCIVEVLFDSDGKPEDYRFLEVNDAFERQTGLHDAVGKRMREFAPAHEEHWFEIYGKIALTGEPAHFMNEARALNRWFDVHAYRVGEPEMRRVAIVFNDFSDYKKAQEALLRSEKLAYQRQQLQALAERLQQAREEERKMVARDLHDDIGQILTAIKMDMSWVVRHLPRANDEVHDRLKGSIELINDGVRSVRKICSGLRPGILDDLGLAAAIEWQSNEFAARTGISCQVSVPVGELVLDGDRATALFRIFQECLTNVARHAEARSVRATLRAEDKNLLLVVQDDGKGFLESEVAGSLGVLGMKERAQACGGSVQVSSSPGKGTTVTVRVPVRAPSAELEDHAYSDSR
jgi:PAS domain S-box-containing protein